MGTEQKECTSDLFKNDVPAAGQVTGEESVFISAAAGAACKIAFFGNSITRHGRAERLGWYGDWGMAASAREKDYVHRLLSYMERGGRRVSYCVANLSEWERTRDGRLLAERYAAAFSFGADIAVLHLGENAQLAEHLAAFSACYAALAARLRAGGAKVVLTDLFWEYEPFDVFVKDLAEREGYMFVQLHDLGSRDDMKAIGTFTHAGVAAHPGDAGMEQIAARIYAAIRKNEKGITST